MKPEILGKNNNKLDISNIADFCFFCSDSDLNLKKGKSIHPLKNTGKVSILTRKLNRAKNLPGQLHARWTKQKMKTKGTLLDMITL